MGKYNKHNTPKKSVIKSDGGEDVDKEVEEEDTTTDPNTVDPIDAPPVEDSQTVFTDTSATMEHDNRDKNDDSSHESTTARHRNVKGLDEGRLEKEKQDQLKVLRESNSRVDPTQDKMASHKGKKKSSVPDNAVIRSINGRELTLCDGDNCEDIQQDCIVNIHKKAEVYLNGKKMTLAALDNGDKVVLSKGGKEQFDQPFEYKRVDATREDK